MAEKKARGPAGGHLKFLVCVDDSEDARTALRFACLRARNTGGALSLVYVIEPTEFRQWGTVEKKILEDARREAQEVLENLAGEVFREFGVRPEFDVREGDKADAILAAADEDESINVVVVGCAPEGEGSNRLMTGLTAELTRRLRIPLTIVPGNLSAGQLARIT